MKDQIKLTKEWIIPRLPKRPQDANKGTFGKVLVVAGSTNFPGAAYLTCAAAYRVGAGLVTLATEESVKIIVFRKLPEVTFLSFDEVTQEVEKYDVLLFGPGLGQSKKVVKLVNQLLRKRELTKVVIDGDGLNILAQISNWWDKLTEQTILTPHPGEMSRLTGLSVKQIQTDRSNVAQYFAKKWNKTVVLKGANTIVTSPTPPLYLSPFANPILSTAGTGDVLAGVIAGMLAQGLKPVEAATVGVYLHGLAGETLRRQIGEAGGLASDLLPLLPLTIKQININS